ncbi:MAG: enoyl-CoA hydratase/isomerase family protein [Flavobacteriales bacterium]|nr:enoyl-CoA hydratase/isomerase family protein [Flavobacteriales bacterium]
MVYQFIETELKNHYLTISINREDKMNALNSVVLREIKMAITVAETNDEVFGILITGKGQKAFAAGADIAEFKDFDISEGTKLSRDGHDVMNTLENCKKPTIAAVNGFALGGGCELAMACHLRVASSNAKFGQPEINLGLIPGYGGTQRLVQYIGKTKATELLITGDMISADEAFKLGLVNYVVETDQLFDKCYEILDKVSNKSPQAVSAIFACVSDYFNSDKNGMNSEIESFGKRFQTTDFIEGTNAFVEKRRANFRK